MSRNNRIALLAVTLLLSVPMLALSGNSNDFEVSSFIPKHFSDFEWKIGGNLSLTGTDSDRETEVAPGFGLTKTSLESSSNRQNFGINTESNYYYETVKRQIELKFLFDGYFYHTGNETVEHGYPDAADSRQYERDEYSQSLYNFRARASGTVRQYLDNNLFGELTLAHNFDDRENTSNDRYRYNQLHFFRGDTTWVNTIIQDNESSGSRSQYAGKFEFALGTGHVWEGSFAVTALYVIDALREHQLLDREPRKDQMLGLTKLIYEYRLTHPVDTRYHRQEALNSIIEYLQDERIIRDLSGPALYAIQDVWDYYPTRKSAPRQFGYRAKVGFGYRLTHESDDNEYRGILIQRSVRYFSSNPSVVDTLLADTSVSYSNSSGSSSDEIPYFILGGEYHLPISQYWQFDAEGFLNLNLESPTDELWHDRTSWGMDQLQTALALSRHFDSRTMIRANFNTDFRFRKLDAPADISYPTYPDTREIWRTYLILETELSLYHRIAVPTALKVTASFISRFTREPEYALDLKDDSNEYNLYATITHYLY